MLLGLACTAVHQAWLPADSVMFEIHEGDALDVLTGLASESTQCCVTSPPYWGLRDYNVDGQIGLEKTPDEYVESLVCVFRELRRVLRDDGTLWLNIGDSYAAGGKGGGGSFMAERKDAAWQGRSKVNGWRTPPHGLKPKDLVGIPWRVAFALQKDGWYLRSDIIWAKPNPMPESVTDRPTKAHEYVFLLSKSARYYFDADAVREESVGVLNSSVGFNDEGQRARQGVKGRTYGKDEDQKGRNIRTVWPIATSPFPGAHFAVMPPKLVEPCIMAGSKKRDVILDPFAGAGTVGLVSDRLDRDFVGIELNHEYAAMARRRIEEDAPLFNRCVDRLGQ